MNAKPCSASATDPGSFAPVTSAPRNPAGALDPFPSARRVVLVYTIVAALWILFSDAALHLVVPDPARLAGFQTLKGYAFVAVTATLLYLTLRRQLGNLQTALVARDEAQQAAHRYAMLASHSRDIMLLLRRSDGRILEANRAAELAYGLRHDELLERTLGDVCVDSLDTAAAAGEAEGAGRCFEAIHRRAGGTSFPVEVTVQGSRINGTDVLAVVARDITARKNAEAEMQRIQAALAEETTRRRILFEQSPDCIVLLDPLTLRFVEFNEAAHRHLGYTREEFAGLSISAIDAIHSLGERRAVLETLVRDGRADFETVHRTKHGALIDVEVTVQLIEILGRSYQQWVCRDITARKRMEAALQASEERFREVVETIQEVFWVMEVNPERVTYVSPAYEEIWGRPGSELCTSSQPWVDSIRAEDRERILHAMRTKLLTGGYDETYRIVRADSAIRWVHVRAYPVKGKAGNVIRVVGVAEDITDRKKLEEQFLHAQRLEAIGTLASGVAHDLNNILAPIFMIAPMLQGRISDPADLQMLDIVQRSAARGASVIRQLLTFSRGVAGGGGPLQPRHLLKEMAVLMQETFPREIAIAQTACSDLWPVVGDPTQLHQVLMNLCVNARDAMPGGGQLTITGQNITLTEAQARMQPGAAPGPYVMITVADTGHGIPSEIRSRIFDPFFTTKAVGKGTGLGLCTVLGIVKSHGGFVTVDSEPDCGCAFRVYLPADGRTLTPAALPQSVESPRGQGEWVLIVDDEPAVRDTMRQVLEAHGYRVLTAGNGREALAVFLPHHEDVAIVVTDIMMPEMGGVALVRALHEFRPGLPIIAASGLQQLEDPESLGMRGLIEVLNKPYAPAELIAALQRALAKAAKPAAAAHAPNHLLQLPS